jgi:hypothetical protein
MFDSVLFLFLYDFSHQVLFYFGAVGGVAVLIYDKWKDKPLQIRPVMILLGICIFVSCFQAWVDEHRNSEQLKIEKALSVGESGFWKTQSYAKDDDLRRRDQDLRARDQALAENFKTLNNTQKSLTDLSVKVLDITKPEPLQRTIAHAINPHNERPPAAYFVDYVLLTNKLVSPVQVVVECDRDIVSVTEWVMGTGGMTTGGWGGRIFRTQWGIGINSPAWSTYSPIQATIWTNERYPRCSFNQR